MGFISNEDPKPRGHIFIKPQMKMIIFLRSRLLRLRASTYFSSLFNLRYILIWFQFFSPISPKMSTSRSLVLKHLSVSDLVSALAQPQKLIWWKNWIFPACRTWLISTKSIAFLKGKKIPYFPKNLEWVDLWCLNTCLSRIWFLLWRSPKD